MKKLLIALPGWGFGVSVFNQLAAQCADHYDVRGINYIDYCAAPHHSLDAVVHRIASCFSEPAVVLGWSLGGIIAIKLAAYYPQKVRAVFTLGTNPHFLQAHAWGGIEPDAFYALHDLLVRDHRACLQRILTLSCQTHAGHDKIAWRQLSTHLLLTAEIHALTTSLLWLTDDYRPSLAAIPCAQTHFFAAQDALVPAACALSINQQMPAVRTVLLEQAQYHAAGLMMPHLLAPWLECR